MLFRLVTRGRSRSSGRSWARGRGVIDTILAEDKARPTKQRHTTKRIFERLRAEYEYTGGYMIVKDYMRQSRIGGQEMFVPLSQVPGAAQANFGEVMVVIAGVECNAHFMAFDLPHSDDCFVQAFRAETTEAFLEGHVRAFEYFYAVPTYILYDNTTLAVARILGDGQRQNTLAFSELQSYSLFAEKFGRPAKGNDKGKVENLLGYARRNFMVPIPQAASWEALSAQLAADCCARRAPFAWSYGDHCRAIQARPCGHAAAAGRALRSLRQDHCQGQLDLAGPL